MDQPSQDQYLDMNKIAPILERGANFSLLMRNEVFGDALQEAKLAMFEEIANSDIDDTKTREECFMVIYAFNKIYDIMDDTISVAIDLQQRIEQEQEEQSSQE